MIGYIIIVLIAQSIFTSILFYKSLDSVNHKIINQNFALVDKIKQKDEELLKDIIPIITGKHDIDKESLNNGEKILSNYSYDNSLKYKQNPLVGNIRSNYIGLIIVIGIVFLIVLIIGILYLINPLFKEIRYLTYRAENIVEQRTSKNEKYYKYEGSLDKFIAKFYMMEERIHNSIHLLQDEKINLKNIINDISHQLKTPLMALTMYNDILSDHRNMDKDDVDNFLGSSSEQLERMDWLVKTLLKYARLESNVVEYHKENFLLNNTVEESINPLIIKANEKNQSITFKCDKDIYLYHDRKWISEAFSNIVKNAIEHTDNGGKIEIGIDETPIKIRVWIKDNGEGIDKKEIKKIFNRFHKGENSINPTSIGIGLCLSKSIFKAHHGDISVESELGVGSTFYVIFIKNVD